MLLHVCVCAEQVVRDRTHPTLDDSLWQHFVPRLGGKELNNIAAVGDLVLHSDQSLFISKRKCTEKRAVSESYESPCNRKGKPILDCQYNMNADISIPDSIG